MSVSARQASGDAVADVLDRIRRKGVRLWSKDGRLHYCAPKGVLTSSEIEHLKASKNQIVAVLEADGCVEPSNDAVASPSTPRLIPLSWSQQQHWNLYRLHSRPAVRQVASATSVTGPLDIKAFKQSLAEIIRRHDALRTRIVGTAEGPMQEIALSNEIELEILDEMGCDPSSRAARVQEAIKTCVLKPFDVAREPLIAVQLLKFHDEEHVLIVAMEHMISDAASMRILLRELFMAYTQLVRTGSIALPRVPVQFSDYSFKQRRTHSDWLVHHGAYWEKHLQGCGRVRFPFAAAGATADAVGWKTVPFGISKETREKLQEWCRIHRTTLALSVFNAYAAAILRWCDVPEALLQYQSDGRMGAKVDGAIGYFAAVLYMRTRLLAGDSFSDLVREVTDEYCRAFKHADFSYMESQEPRPDFTRNSGFNWIPGGLDVDSQALDAAESPVRCAGVSFVHPLYDTMDSDNEPSITLHDIASGVRGEISYPKSRFSQETIERFARTLSRFIEEMLRDPGQLVRDIPVV